MENLDTSGADPVRAPRRRGVRTGIFAAGAAFGVTLASLGIAGAQTSGPGTAPTERAAGKAVHRGADHLAAAAEALGITPAELQTALRSGQSIAQVALSKNVPVQKVIDAMVADARENLVARVTELVNRTGHGAHKGPGRHGPVAKHLDGAAEALGVTPAELQTALRSGQSIAQVAQSKNVPVQTVIDALVADARARLAEKVAAGELTQAQADEKATDLVARVTDHVNRTGGHGRPGR